MNDQRDAIRRALEALCGDGDEQPGHEVLEAYVEGRLTPDERAVIDRLAARSTIVAEDIADLRAIHDAIASRPVAARDRRSIRTAVIAAIAASLVAAIWVSNRPVARPDAPPAVTALSSQEADLVRQTIERGQIELGASTLSLRQREGTLLGPVASPATFGPVSPIGTVVLSTRPTFTWSTNGADAYTVAIFDENFNEISRSPRLQTSSWTATTDLAVDGRYAWQVTAHRGAIDDTEPKPPRPEARFVVTNQTTASEMKALMDRLQQEPLALGILMSRYGFVADGRAALQRALNDPRTAGDARRLLQSLDQGTPITTKPAQ